MTRGDTLVLDGTPLRVRRLQVHGEPVETASGPTRLAVNLRAVAAADVPRGSAPAVPGSATADRRGRRRAAPPLRPDAVARDPARRHHLGCGAGAAAGAAHARLTLDDPSAALPLVTGDRVVLRDPGAHQVLAGATVLDAHPPPLTRRGDAARRAAALAAGTLRSGSPTRRAAWQATPGGWEAAGIRRSRRTAGAARRAPARAGARRPAGEVDPGRAGRGRAGRAAGAAGWARPAGRHPRGRGVTARLAAVEVRARRGGAGAGHQPSGRRRGARAARRAGR